MKILLWRGMGNCAKPGICYGLYAAIFCSFLTKVFPLQSLPCGAEEFFQFFCREEYSELCVRHAPRHTKYKISEQQQAGKLVGNLKYALPILKLSYKYFPLERVSYFDDALLRLTQPGDLNDPFECLPVLPSIEDTIIALEILLQNNVDTIKKLRILKSEKKVRINLEVRKFKAAMNAVKKGIPDNWRERFYNQSVQGKLSMIGIVSFSKRWDSTLMWSHYTASHRGFCIGFNNEDPFFNNFKSEYKSDVVFEDVFYSNDRLRIPINEGESLDYNLMFRKSEDWKYEEEERLLLFLTKAKKRIRKDPFDICLIEIPHYLIKEIIVGANCLETTRELIERFCVGKDIKLFQSEISETHFNMIKSPI